jgi:IS605 OrfB family transposase
MKKEPTDNNTEIITRKIQLLVDEPDKDLERQAWQTLYRWQQVCFRAANTIMSHIFVQEQLPNMSYLADEVQRNLADMHKHPGGLLCTSRINSTLRLLSRQYKGQIPIHILGRLNMTLHRDFTKKRNQYLEGEKTVPSFHRRIPIPVCAADIRGLAPIQDSHNYRLRIHQLPFRSFLGADWSDKPALLQQVVNEQIKLCDSHLLIHNKRLFLLAVFRRPLHPPPPGNDTVAEVSLSPETPITVRIAGRRYTIGSKEEFLYRRLAIQQARQRVQQSIGACRGGHGATRKRKALDAFEEREKNFVHNRLHTYSRRLVDLCLQHHAATILLVGQQEKEAAAKEDAFLLRNWSYYALKEKIWYKARRAGITVVSE